MQLEIFRCGLRHCISMQMDRVPNRGRTAEMVELERTTHIRQEVILNDQNQLLVDVFKRLGLVVHLNEGGLCSHLPVHTEGFVRVLRLITSWDANLFQEPLPFWPNCPRGIECLKLDANEIFHFAVSGRHKEEIHAAARNRYF